MITFSVFYPYKKDSHFDMDYYCNKHLGIVKRYFGDTCKGMLVLKGDNEEDMEPRFSCTCHLFFNTEKEFLEIMEKANAELMADVKNYTDIEPFTEINEISMQE
jgi:uncharacterized protein (TIGR02118 family)